MKFPSMKFFSLPEDAPRGLKVLQIAQASIVALTAIAAILTAIIPQKHKAFTFGLLYSLIFMSMSTSFLLRKEQALARTGTLTKQKYIKYQIFKMVAAFGLSFVGFIMWIASCPKEQRSLKPGESGLILGGVKINRYQGWILWIHTFNWIFLWSSLFYSCCMTAQKQGPIALAGDEATLGADDVSDEEYARRVQAEDPNWRA